MMKHSVEEVEIINETTKEGAIPIKPMKPIATGAPVIANLRLAKEGQVYVGDKVEFAYDMVLGENAVLEEEQWTNKETVYNKAGQVTVMLRIKDNQQLWSNEISVTFTVKAKPQTGGNQMVNNHYLDDLYELKVANVVLTDLDTNVELYSASLETHSISAALETEEIKAGQENQTFVVLQKSKTITVELSDVMSKMDWQAAKMNAELNEELVVVSQFPKNYVLKDNSEGGFEFELDHEPYKGILPAFYNKKTKAAIDPSNITLEGKVVTITDGAGLEDGQIVFGSSYKYETTAEVMKIAKADKAKHFRVEMHIPILNSSLELVKTKKIIFHKAAMSGDWSTEGNTEVGKNNMDTTLTILADDNYEDLGYIVYENPVK